MLHLSQSGLQSFLLFLLFDLLMQFTLVTVLHNSLDHVDDHDDEVGDDDQRDKK